MKVVTIIENDPILGVKYGTVEVPATGIAAQDAYKRTQEKARAMRAAKIRRENTKHK